MPSHDDIPREVLPIPDRKPVSLTTYDAKVRTPSSRRSRRCGRRPAPPTCSSFCSMMSALAHRARSAGPCQTPTAERLAARA